MALLADLPDPYGEGTLAAVYVKRGPLIVDPINKVIVQGFVAFRNEAASRAGRAPLPIPLEFRLGPVGDPGTEEVRDDEGVLVQSARPAVPSYDQFVAALRLILATGKVVLAPGVEAPVPGWDGGEPTVDNILATAAYTHAKAQPMFANALDT